MSSVSIMPRRTRVRLASCVLVNRLDLSPRPLPGAHASDLTSGSRQALVACIAEPRKSAIGSIAFSTKDAASRNVFSLAAFASRPQRRQITGASGRKRVVPPPEARAPRWCTGQRSLEKDGVSAVPQLEVV